MFIVKSKFGNILTGVSSTYGVEFSNPIFIGAGTKVKAKTYRTFRSAQKMADKLKCGCVVEEVK